MGNGRKTWLGLLVAACVALALAVPAFATIGSAGYTTWNPAWPGNGSSPHNGFTTTTQKCVVCHAVHNADDLGEALLRGSVANACTYCHVNLASAYTQVYSSNIAFYNADTIYGHNSWNVAGVDYGVKCTGCHQVHAAQSAMTANDYLRTKLLKGSTLAAGYDTHLGATAAPSNGDTTGTALTKWCTSCHGATVIGPDASPDYYTYQFNGSSHVMTSAASIATYGNASTSVAATQVAYIASDWCQSCHASGYQTSAWPHYTPGARFLVGGTNALAGSTAATSTEADGICLRCHVNGTGGGVNMGF